MGGLNQNNARRGASLPASSAPQAIVDRSVILPGGEPHYLTQETHDGLYEQLREHLAFFNDLVVRLSFPNFLPTTAAFADWIVAHHVASSSAPQVDARDVSAFVHAILHGDADHRAWLVEAGEAWKLGQQMPPPRGKGASQPQVDAREGAEPVAKLRDLVQCLLDNEPDEPISDAGHRVLDMWRHDARRVLSEIDAAPPPRPDPATDGGWRSITSADYDDHKRVLLFIPAWSEGDPVRLGAWWAGKGWATRSGVLSAHTQPTHVMDLPSPPEPVSPKPADARACTCHPDDNPPKPCPQRYALGECRAAADQPPADALPTDRDAAGGASEAALALERDRSLVAQHLGNLREVMEGYGWLREAGRGSYAYNDDRYQREFGDALDAMEAAIEPLRTIARDWTHCPRDPALLALARRLDPTPGLQSATDALRQIAALRHSLPRETIHEGNAVEAVGRLNQRIIGIFDSADAALAADHQDRTAPAVGEDEAEAVYEAERAETKDPNGLPPWHLASGASRRSAYRIAEAAAKARAARTTPPASTGTEANTAVNRDRSTPYHKAIDQGARPRTDAATSTGEG